MDAGIRERELGGVGTPEHEVEASPAAQLLSDPLRDAPCEEPASSAPLLLRARPFEALERRIALQPAVVGTLAPDPTDAPAAPRPRFVHRKNVMRGLAVLFLLYVSVFNFSVVRGSSMSPASTTATAS